MTNALSCGHHGYEIGWKSRIKSKILDEKNCILLSFWAFDFVNLAEHALIIDRKKVLFFVQF